MTDPVAGMERALMSALRARRLKARVQRGSQAGPHIAVATACGTVQVWMQSAVTGDDEYVVIVDADTGDDGDNVHAATFPIGNANGCALFIHAMHRAGA